MYTVYKHTTPSGKVQFWNTVGMTSGTKSWKTT